MIYFSRFDDVTARPWALGPPPEPKPYWEVPGPTDSPIGGLVTIEIGEKNGI